MAWGTLLSSTQLSLSGSWQTVQRSAADWEITLNPGELAQVVLDYNPQATPTEYCHVLISRTADGTVYETDNVGHMLYVIQNDDDPGILSIEVTGVYGFKIRAALFDTDGTVGGDDTGSTLDVDVRVDGVSV